MSKLLLAAITTITLFASCGKDLNDEISKDFKRDFKKYYSSYELNKPLYGSKDGLVIKFGDLNNDNHLDAAVEFSFLLKKRDPETGNAYKGINGLLVYINDGTDNFKLKYYMDDFYLYQLDSVFQNEIRIKQYSYTDSDAICCPSISTLKYIKTSDLKKWTKSYLFK